MNFVSRIALGFALAAGGIGAVASAQQAAIKTPKYTKAQAEALKPLDDAYALRSWSAAQAALPAAEAVATTPDTKYYVGNRKFRIGHATNNTALQLQGIEMMVNSGFASPSEMPRLYGAQATLANGLKQWDHSEAALRSWIQAEPSNPEPVTMLSEARFGRKQYAEAIQQMSKAIEMKRASGQPVPESWYRRAITYAYQGSTADKVRSTRDWLAAYPSKTNWRDALLLQRDVAGTDANNRVDICRLMRVSNALSGERDYAECAGALDKGGHPAEAKAVLDAGVSQKMIESGKAPFKDLLASTGRRAASAKSGFAAAERGASSGSGSKALEAADTAYGLGEYGKAATLYQLALTKGGVDASLVNLRLGAALGQSGQKPAADMALRAVTGPRADIAALWQIWLSRQA